MSSRASLARKASKKKKQQEEDNNNNNIKPSSTNIMTGTIEEVKASEAEEETPSTPASAKTSSTPKRYIYRDFAQISDESFDSDFENEMDQEGLMGALEESTNIAATQASHHEEPSSYLESNLPIPMRASGWVRSQRFPVKLYALLSQPRLSHIITWMPHGRSWKVLQPRIFEAAVLPVFFESDNYHSFNRVINAWSFRRKSSGPDRGSYFHELFLRGKPRLQKYMRRLPRTHKKLAMSKEDEPDFYELHKTSPLPTLEEAQAAQNARKLQVVHHNIMQQQQQQPRLL